MLGHLLCCSAPAKTCLLAITVVDRHPRGAFREFWDFCWSLACPWGGLTVLVLVAGAIMIELIRYRRPTGVGLCPECGYDLRASPDYCPECGRRRTKARPARVLATLTLDAGSEKLSLPILDEYQDALDQLRREFPRQFFLLFGFKDPRYSFDAPSEQLLAAVQQILDASDSEQGSGGNRFRNMLRRIRQFTRKHAFTRVKRSLSGYCASDLPHWAAGASNPCQRPNSGQTLGA